MRRGAHRDIAQEVTDIIIAKIDQGELPWRRPGARLALTDVRCAPAVSRTPASTPSCCAQSPTATNIARGSG